MMSISVVINANLRVQNSLEGKKRFFSKLFSSSPFNIYLKKKLFAYQSKCLKLQEKHILFIIIMRFFSVRWRRKMTWKKNNSFGSPHTAALNVWDIKIPDALAWKDVWAVYIPQKNRKTPKIKNDKAKNKGNLL